MKCSFFLKIVLLVITNAAFAQISGTSTAIASSAESCAIIKEKVLDNFQRAIRLSNKTEVSREIDVIKDFQNKAAECKINLARMGITDHVLSTLLVNGNEAEYKKIKSEILKEATFHTINPDRIARFRKYANKLNKNPAEIDAFIRKQEELGKKNQALEEKKLLLCRS